MAKKIFNKLINRHSYQELSKGGIYCIQNINNNKMYIGSTKNFNARLRSHSRNLAINSHHSYLLQRAFNKYGYYNFEFKILKVSTVIGKQLLDLEQEYIDKYNTNNSRIGYNISKMAQGGSSECMIQSQIKTKRKNALNTRRSHEDLIELAKKQFNLNNIPSNVKIIDAVKLCVLVDEQDYNDLSQYVWRINSENSVIRERTIIDKNDGFNSATITMPRHLLGIKNRKKIIKHNNNNKQDNRIENLRIAQYVKKKDVSNFLIVELSFNGKPIYYLSTRKSQINVVKRKILDKNFPKIKLSFNNELIEFLKKHKVNIDIIYSFDNVKDKNEKLKELIVNNQKNIFNIKIPGVAISSSRKTRDKMSKTKIGKKNEKISGELNSRSKLTNQDVIYIKKQLLIYNDKIFRTKIATKFNVSEQCIFNIFKGKTWSHIKI